MPKYPKGILGVRKDPKNQILFSFSARQGDEWPSDDDDDSDYRPGYVLSYFLSFIKLGSTNKTGPLTLLGFNSI
jgi:hypothetical protein